MAGTRYVNYAKALKEDTVEFVDYYFNYFLDDIREGGSQDYSHFIDYDGKLHEHMDGDLTLQEAVDIIENGYSEETDSGLWDGLPPIEAIVSMAFWSYRIDLYEAVENEFKDRLYEVRDNEQSKLNALESELEELEGKNEGEYVEKIEELQEKISELDEFINELDSTIDNM